MKDTCLFARKIPTTEEESGIFQNTRDNLYIQNLSDAVV